MHVIHGDRAARFEFLVFFHRVEVEASPNYASLVLSRFRHPYAGKRYFCRFASISQSGSYFLYLYGNGSRERNDVMT